MTQLSSTLHEFGRLTRTTPQPTTQEYAVINTIQTATRPPSPRLRFDYLLLHSPPISELTALEAFATPEGVEAYADYTNLISKASTLLPELRHLAKTLPPEYVAAKVAMALDGITAPPMLDIDLPDGLF